MSNESELGEAPLRILHVATHEGVYRGGAVQLCRMAAAQAARGHKVSAIACESPKKKKEQREKDRASWEPLRSSGVAVEFMDYRRLWGNILLRGKITEGKFDIVHAHRDDALLAAWRAMRWMAGTKLIAQRGTITTPPPRIAKVFCSSRVRAILAVAEAVKHSLVDSIDVDANKIEVVYGSVDIKQFSPRAPRNDLKSGLGIPESAQVIGSLSSYRKAKGLELIVEALARIATARPRVHAVFLGQGVEKKLGPVADAFRVRDRCHFVGHQPNVADWLSMMDVTVIAASGREGLSGVLRESLAMEIPVISTHCAGNCELIHDHKTGLLIPMNDAAALADALLFAFDHPIAMKSMARAGRTWIKENCTPSIQAERIESIYRFALDPTRKAQKTAAGSSKAAFSRAHGVSA